MSSLAERAARWGIEPAYTDVFGQRQEVAPEALERILHLVESAGAAPQDALLPPAVVLRPGHAARLQLARAASDATVLWGITQAGVPLAEGAARADDCRLPDDLPVGSYVLRARVAGAPEDDTHAAPLLVAPERTYQGDDAGTRTWLLAVQLYSVRSHRNWGHGDFTDLATLVDLAADVGAGGIGLNPLHALFDDRPTQASPYAPSSRIFLNVLYIDLDAVPDFPGLDAAGQDEITRLQATELVDYKGVARLKIAGLRLAYARFRASASPDRRRDFAAFRHERGDALARFASFEVLRRRYPEVWWEWPPEWREPRQAALESLRASDGDEVGFYEYAQWIADRQLAACQDRARARGLPIGLYLDVAVGVDAGGADAWSEQGAILRGLSAGAPPDEFNRSGQNWGIAAFHPRGLAASGFEAFRRTIAAAMQHAGAIRIDHVLGLNRLFLVPHGAQARDGAYFRFPLEALLAVVAQESVARRCIVIGEDLGTVPEDLRGSLTDWGLWSYRVLMFERWPDGLFIAPDHYPAMALATFNTHDLPTFTGWQSGHDIAVRQALGMGSESAEDRRRSVDALQGALTYAGIDASERFVAVARYLAATPSRMVVISIEDVLGLADQPNLPGTTDEHPNWQQRLPLPLEDWMTQTPLPRLAQVFREGGRSTPGRSG